MRRLRRSFRSRRYALAAIGCVIGAIVTQLPRTGACCGLRTTHD